MTTAPDSWPVTMPGTDDDPTGGRTHAAALLDAVMYETPQLQPALMDSELPSEVVRIAGQALDAITGVRQVVHRAAGNLDQLATDLMIPEKGREQLIRDTKGTTAAALRDLDARSAVAIKALEAGLTAAAQPTFPDGADRGEARQEMVMLLDAATDPAQTLRDLVTGPDQRLAAMAASPFAETYLRAKGVDEAVIKATKVFAAQAAITSDDPKRKAAGLALTKINDLKKTRTKSLAAANFAIEWDS